MRTITKRLAMIGAAATALLITASANAQQFTMKLSSPTINDVTYEYYKRIKAGIEEKSGGKIKVEIYPANQLGQIPATVEGVALGTIEATSVANGFYISLEPRFQSLDAPGLYPDLMTGYKVLHDPAIHARLATWGEGKGIEILEPGLYAPLMVLSHKAVRTIADFQGQKVRTQGGAPIQIDPIKKLGAIPVSLPLGEALPAMQNKTIDGMITATAPSVAFKYYDIAKPITYLPSTLFAAPVVVSRTFMKSLGPDLEKIVRDEAAKASEAWADWNINDIKAKEDVWKKNGGEIITMSPDDSKKYLDVVTPVVQQILATSPKVKEDYEALQAAVKKYKQ